MSKRQWLVLLMLFLTYLLLGAAMFYHIESALEIEKVNRTKYHRIEINQLLLEHYKPSEDQDINTEILNKLGEYCGKSVHNYTADEVDIYNWDFYNSFYFAYTVVSTIGYGNLAPTSMLGRILMIFYGLIGIPMNGILLSQLGEFFGNVFIRAHKKYKTYKEGRSDSLQRLNPLETRRAGLAVQIFIYLTPGFIMFIFFPAFLFSYWEGWTYDQSVYYAFVTLSTIGFGDLVAGQDNTKGNGFWWYAYKTFLIFWISFGLGYLVMIMSFIARGMRSKKITRLEHMLVTNLKQTQSKIWNEFNRDINYIRRVFNEVYLMKLQPVYKDDCDWEVLPNELSRSFSFPDLRELIYGGLEPDVPVHPRRRANSEIAQMARLEAINRVVSDTDIHRIDKKATFASQAVVQPAELLAHLVNAMSYIPPAFDDLKPPAEEEEDYDLLESKGIDGFSDKDILASEKPWHGSGWKIGGDKVPEPRMRAASEIGFRKDYNNGFANQHNSEWTWSGPAASRKIQELMKARKNDPSNQNKETKSRMPSFSLASVPKSIRPRWFNRFSNKKHPEEESRRDSTPTAEDIETNLRENYLSHTTNTRPMKPPDRRRSAAPHYFTHTGGNLPNSPDSNLLEETSLADFFRALTSLHSRVGAVPEDLINRPQRKMGTASLTPPEIPSLLSLFSPPTGFNSQTQSNQSTVTPGQTAARRYSLRPVGNSGNSTPSYQRRDSFVTPSGLRRFSVKRSEESSGTSTPNYQRRDSIVTPSGVRRFSLRHPEDNSGTSTPTYQRRGSLVPSSRSPRRYSLKSSLTSGRPALNNSSAYAADTAPLHIQERRNPPPYSADPFIFECPKESLVSAEMGPARDEIPLPVRAAQVPRRFSLRPAQIGVPPAPALPKTPPMGRPVPRWKGGMLQRQISEMNLQRRARAFSLGDVHSIRNDRFLTNPISPLALPKTTSNLSTIFANQPMSRTEDNEKTDSQAQDITSTVVPSGGLPSRTINDARQTSGSIDQLPEEQSSNDKTQMTVNAALRSEVNKPDQSAATAVTELTMFAEDERGSDEARTTVRQSKESAVPLQASSAYQPIYTPTSGKLLTAIEIDDRTKSAKPSSELHSVVVDKPLSIKTHEMQSGNKEDSLFEVKVESPVSVKSVGDEDARKASAALDMSRRKISMISEKSTGSTVASSDEERPGGRKNSTMSQQNIELGSISGSRKTSTTKSKMDKPRVSVDSYKPLVELKIEKPATNPFEQYKATVQCNLDTRRERRSLDSRKSATELKGDVAAAGRHRHSTPSPPSQLEAVTQASAKHKDPEV